MLRFANALVAGGVAEAFGLEALQQLSGGGIQTPLGKVIPFGEASLTDF
jgi:hypothetical protein